MYLFPLGKRILAIRAVSSGISGNLWGCRDIAFLLLLSTFLLPSYYSSPKYPSFLFLCQYHWPTESLNQRCLSLLKEMDLLDEAVRMGHRCGAVKLIAPRGH